MVFRPLGAGPGHWCTLPHSRGNGEDILYSEGKMPHNRKLETEPEPTTAGLCEIVGNCLSARARLRLSVVSIGNL